MVKNRENILCPKIWASGPFGSKIYITTKKWGHFKLSKVNARTPKSDNMKV